MGRQPRELLVRNLLGEHWDTSETFGLTPHISFGWWEEAKETPQITISEPDEGPLGGGETGYDAMSPAGEQLNQTFDGTIRVHCWGRDRDMSSATTSYARQYYAGDANQHGAREEIREIIRDNARMPEDPVTGETPVNVIAPLGGESAPEPNPGSEVIHYIELIGYSYLTT